MLKRFFGLPRLFLRQSRNFIVLCIFSGIILTGGQGCITNSLRRQQRKVEKTQEKSNNEGEKFYKKAVKSHQKKQSEDTRKMMKKTKKKSRNFNKHLDRRFFLWRWLNL